MPYIKDRTFSILSVLASRFIGVCVAYSMHMSMSGVSRFQYRLQYIIITAKRFMYALTIYFRVRLSPSHVSTPKILRYIVQNRTPA